ncbi:MAG: UDP-N-acetylglucosamine--N-acetylmuramyl-(pentapeptide) pyrophosphoryl-undecaprenol N-acetylglucosamine transferase [Planctomycetota bacterium]|nr:UDP-N-acetylglucosamine--N-acetylmuramyl-(pentapeptide) pyrophosphoryl-undecaprenol N-acetylglucosamine transferase [Planctomycetota bacterium]
MSLPYFLLEQNTVPGKVTRHFAPSARAVFSQFTEARQRLAKNVIFQHTGSPVRKSIIDTIHNAKDNRLSKSETILVLGGSQGSRKINRTVCASLPELELELPGLKMLHLAGKLDFEEVQQAYEGRSAHEVYDFVDEIEELYVRCTAVIARAGAVSLAELFNLFLVPFPYAADDHQTKNARVYEKQNAAEVLRQGELSPQTLTKTLSATLRDTAQRKRMCDQILKFARPNAAQLICDTVLDEI